MTTTPSADSPVVQHLIPQGEAGHEVAVSGECPCNPFSYDLKYNSYGADGEVVVTDGLPEVRHNSFSALPMDESVAEAAVQALSQK